jgi:hypothetical protein
LKAFLSNLSALGGEEIPSFDEHMNKTWLDTPPCKEAAGIILSAIPLRNLDSGA